MDFRISQKIKASIFICMMTAVLISCSLNSEKKSVQQTLEEMNITEAKFASMPACKQIEIYTAVGLHHLDLDHSTVLVPYWMDQAIDANPPEVVADCIAEQGFERLDQLDKQPDAQLDHSYAIHALVYKADNSGLLVYPRTKEFLQRAVCDSNLMYEYQLILIDYRTTFATVPDYIMDSDSDQRMKQELCH